MRMFLAGLLGVSGLSFAQTRIGPVDVRIGEVSEKPRNDKSPDSNPQPQEIAPTDQVADAELTIAQIRKLFLELEHPDGKIRERSRERLMNLKRDELKMLVKVVGEFAPLEDQMVYTLKDIVTHVYLSDDNYEKEDKGFLGITMPRPGDEDRMQVMVESRMAGFGGYSALRDGDVILDVLNQPQPQPLDREVFIDAIKAMRPGTIAKLKILRQGAVRTVPVKVSARPAEKAAVNALAYEGKVAELLYRRAEAAEKYWKDTFSPVVGAKDLKTSASTTSN